MAAWRKLRGVRYATGVGVGVGVGVAVIGLLLVGCSKAVGPDAKEDPDADAGPGDSTDDGHEGSQIGGCGNGVDDDGDGMVDCDDPDCIGAPDCEVVVLEDTGFAPWDPRDLQYKFVSAGYAHACGMDFAGEVHCWGDNSDGQTDAVDGTYTAMSAGGAHTCAVSTNGRMVCWGKGFDDGSIEIPGEDFWEVGASGTGACGIALDNPTPVCFGIEVDGEPMSVPADRGVYELSLGWNHGCAIADDDSAYCWGENDEGQTDVPETSARYIGIDAGGKHTCGLVDGGVPVCWGSDEWGQSSPPDGVYLINISAGSTHTCGVSFTGEGVLSLVCWGGKDPDADGATPPSGSFTRSSAGGGHSCALTEAGEINCWGDLSWDTSVPQ